MELERERNEQETQTKLRAQIGIDEHGNRVDTHSMLKLLN